jgi:micrococcal nuclease
MRIINNLAAAATALMIAVALTGCQFAAAPASDQATSPSAQEQTESPSGPADPGPEVGAHPEEQVVQVLRVVDGDTIAVSPTASLPATNAAGTEHLVRMLGIDTPEMNKSGEEPAECGAQEALDRLSTLLNYSSEVTIVYDAQADRTDRFGRSLAYVQLIDERKTDLAFILALDGYAAAWYPSGEPEPMRFANYAQAQAAAEQAGSGAYATCESVGR